MDSGPLRPPFAGAIAMVAQLAGRAAAALRALLECRQRRTDWYQVHREMWIRYGDPGDLAAMTNHVTQVT